MKRQLKTLGNDLKEMGRRCKAAIKKGGKGVGVRQTTEDVMNRKFYNVLAKRFMKCAKVQDSLQKNLIDTKARFHELLRYWGESKKKFEKLRGFLQTFAEFAVSWDEACSRIQRKLGTAATASVSEINASRNKKNRKKNKEKQQQQQQQRKQQQQQQQRKQQQQRFGYVRTVTV